MSKIKNWLEALEWREKIREKGLKVVFTNGCFDILHLGHVKLLEEARLLGDKLIVGLNSDFSVKKIKGDSRPIRDEMERAEILAGLSAVDVVVIFTEPDPLKLITYLKPDILVKGGDWKVENIIGADVVKSSKGRVMTIPLFEGKSTTGIIEKIKNSGYQKRG